MNNVEEFKEAWQNYLNWLHHDLSTGIVAAMVETVQRNVAQQTAEELGFKLEEELTISIREKEIPYWLDPLDKRAWGEEVNMVTFLCRDPRTRQWVIEALGSLAAVFDSSYDEGEHLSCRNNVLKDADIYCRYLYGRLIERAFENLNSTERRSTQNRVGRQAGEERERKKLDRHRTRKERPGGGRSTNRPRTPAAHVEHKVQIPPKPEAKVGIQRDAQEQAANHLEKMREDFLGNLISWNDRMVLDLLPIQEGRLQTVRNMSADFRVFVDHRGARRIYVGLAKNLHTLGFSTIEAGSIARLNRKGNGGDLIVVLPSGGVQRDEMKALFQQNFTKRHRLHFQIDNPVMDSQTSPLAENAKPVADAEDGYATLVLNTSAEPAAPADDESRTKVFNNPAAGPTRRVDYRDKLFDIMQKKPHLVSRRRIRQDRSVETQRNFIENLTLNNCRALKGLAVERSSPFSVFIFKEKEYLVIGEHDEDLFPPPSIHTSSNEKGAPMSFIPELLSFRG
ncbi:hypothetical protein [Streptomyces sp. NPDC047981]|uniref:hypothetical protein n=1 Tax=Streptomyces sp. NPDC047981 TaxID=3154610 RepID=UPI00342F1312